MPAATPLTSQIFGDSALFSGLKKGGVLGAQTAGTDIFQSLLAGIGQTPANTILTASLNTKKATTIDPAQAVLNVVTFLKTLSPDDFKNLPPEIASALAPYLAQTSSNPLGVLDSFSVTPDAATQTPDLFTAVNDPVLAEFLAGVVAQLHTTPDSTKSFATFLPVAISNTKFSGTENTAPNNDTTLSINVADLDLEGFDAFKKLAFADIAAFLTQPRTVRVDGNNVMKVAQGPSFLNDDTTNSTLMSAIAGIAATLPTAFNKTSQTLQTVPSVQTGASTTTATVALPNALNRNNIMAALLGIAPQNTTTQKGTEKNDPAAKTPVTTTPEKTTTNTTTTVQAQVNPALVTAAAPVLATRVGAIMKGLDHSLAQFETDNTPINGLENGLPLRADQSTSTTNFATTMMSAKNAGLPHPSTHLVSVVLQRGVEGGIANTTRQFSVELDPANLGRVKITMEFDANNRVKAKLMAERPETLALLQKDSGILQKALSDSGVDTNNSTLTFDLAQDGTFSGGHDGHGGHQNNQENFADENGTDFATQETIETVMPIFVDPETGMTHVNVVI